MYFVKGSFYRSWWEGGEGDGGGREVQTERERCFMPCLALFIYITCLSLSLSPITHPVDFMCYLQRFKITVCSVNLNSLEVTVGGD